MKTKVLVLIPATVPPEEIGSFILSQLAPYRLDEDAPKPGARFDYLTGPQEDSFADGITESHLPESVRQDYGGNICEMSRLPEKVNAGALVTADGKWHDLSDYGWKMSLEPSRANRGAFIRWEATLGELLRRHAGGWVVAVWAHS